MSTKEQQINEETRPRKVRGTATIFGDNRIEFQPQAEGAPQRKDEKRKGLSAFYRTSGEKESSIVAHLRVPADCSDPAAVMFDELQHFTRDMQQKEPKLPQCRKLYESENVSVWHRRGEHAVAVYMKIATDSDEDLSSILFNLTSEVNKCLVINRTSLKKRSK